MALPRQMSVLNIIYINEVEMNVSMRASTGKPAVVIIINILNASAMTRQGIFHYDAKTTAINRISLKDFLTKLQVKMV